MFCVRQNRDRDFKMAYSFHPIIYTFVFVCRVCVVILIIVDDEKWLFCCVYFGSSFLWIYINVYMYTVALLPTLRISPAHHLDYKSFFSGGLWIFWTKWESCILFGIYTFDLIALCNSERGASLINMKLKVCIYKKKMDYEIF